MVWERGYSNNFIIVWPPAVYNVVLMSWRVWDMKDIMTARMEFFGLGSQSLHFFAIYDGHGGPLDEQLRRSIVDLRENRYRLEGKDNNAHHKHEGVVEEGKDEE